MAKIWRLNCIPYEDIEIFCNNSQRLCSNIFEQNSKIVKLSDYKDEGGRAIMQLLIPTAILHPNIIRYRAVGLHPFGKIGIVMNKYKPLESNNVHALKIMGRLFSAVLAIHNFGYIHGDLKPWNVVLNGDEPILIDFETAHIPVPKTDCFCTYAFAPPELLNCESYGTIADVWSLGCIFLWILGIEIPQVESERESKHFTKFYKESNIKNVLMQSKTFWKVVGTSPGNHNELIQIICGMLKYSAGERISLQKLVEHKFFNMFHVDPIYCPNPELTICEKIRHQYLAKDLQKMAMLKTPTLAIYYKDGTEYEWDDPQELEYEKDKFVETVQNLNIHTANSVEIGELKNEEIINELEMFGSILENPMLRSLLDKIRNICNISPPFVGNSGQSYIKIHSQHEGWGNLIALLSTNPVYDFLAL